MADLIAQGSNSQHRWRRLLPGGRWLVLGREGPLAVAWDEHVSRQHAELRFDDGRLEVRRLPSGRNPLFVRGKEAECFEIEPGEHFVIGATTFTLTDDQVEITLDLPAPAEEHTFSSKDLQRLRFRNADRRIDVLSRLPEVISEAADEAELFVRLVNLLLVGIPAADSAALVEAAQGAARGAFERAGAPPAAVRVLHWDRRLAAGGDYQPSERLIHEAVRTGQSVLHVWEPGDEPAPAFTLAESCDWAFCTPVPGAACRGWAIYVSGRFRGAAATPGSADSAIALSQAELRDDLKFTELVAQILSSLRRERQLQRNQAVLSQFFSPAVLGTLAEDPEKVLAPQEADVSVLFCDLRGFSREAERSAGELVELLERVSKALGVMTQHILEHGGVVGDFQGDAALAFWGWPLPQSDAVARACQAALGIRLQFAAAAQDARHSLADFRAGIGIASGRAVAGRIGTQDQVKVTVFGPVVNLASRLEGMTKLLHAPILMDEATAEAVRREVPPEVARCRRVAQVKPYGLDTPLMVSELLPPVSAPPGRERQRAGPAGPVLSDADLANYEAALDAFLAGRWPEAFELLHRVPPEDRVKDFLTVFIAQHNRTPPKNWDGVIPLSSKS